MAVFQGARLRHVGPAEPAIRARTNVAGGTRSSARPMGVLMAVILVATMVGLVYLTQTLGTNATSSEISNLTDKSNDLRDLVNSHTYAVEVGTDPEKVAKAARKLGLERLGDPVILPAR